MGASELERAKRALQDLSSLLNQVDEEDPSTFKTLEEPLRHVLEEVKGLSCLSFEKTTKLLSAAEGLLGGQLESLQRLGAALDEVVIELENQGCSAGEIESRDDPLPRRPQQEKSPGLDLEDKEAEELFMDLEVLSGLAEDLDPSFVPGMINILERNLSRQKLPPSLQEILSRLQGLLKTYGAGESALSEDISSCIRDAVELASALTGKSADQVTGYSSLADEALLEQELERLEELEAYLVAYDASANADINPVVEYLLEVKEKADVYRLSGIEERLSQAARSLQGSPGPVDLTDLLLQLKDKLYSHMRALLERNEPPEGHDEIKRLLDRLVSETSAKVEDNFASDKGKTDAPQPSLSQKAPVASSLKGLEVDPDELTDFVAEAPEDLQRVETALLELEKDPENKEWLNEAFRGFHNLKGSAGFLKLEDMVNVAHAAENLLSEAREGRIKLSGTYADLALQALDLLKEMLKRVEGHLRGETYSSPEEYPEVLVRLRSWREPGQGTDRPLKEDVVKEAVGSSKVVPSDQEVIRSSSPSALDEERKGDKPAGMRDGVAAKTVSAFGSREQFVKVSTTRLDNLIDVVGELVIAHSMVAQEEELRSTKNPRLAKNLSQLAKIIRELQELAMALRMVSLKGTFQKMARAARDLSVRSGVPVDFTYSGEDTEIDRNVVEEIANPLVHMIRNAIDHGIEPPDERRARGKPERGRIHLRGYHQGGNVVIELEDDGRGIDPAKVLAKARTLGLVREDEELSREEVLQLIFREGFSTAEKITDISGRGVGMDVVRRTVESLRGRVEVHSEVGKGTRVVLRLPLTLAIIDGMVTSVGGENYILPSIAIKESFRPAPGQVKTVSGRGELILSRGELIPLFRLHRLFGVQGAVEDPHQALVLVVGENGRKCGLMVDEIEGQQQVVIKPLGDSLPRLPGVAGGAIMGSGRVALILDPQELLCMATRR